MEVKFPGMYVFWFWAECRCNPSSSQIYVVRFYVEGEPEKIVVSLPSNQYLNHSQSLNVFVSKSSILAVACEKGQSENKGNGEVNCCVLAQE